MAQDTTWCQNPRCPERETSGQIRGTKGKKYYQSSKANGYGNGNFCSTWCQDQWLTKHIEQALDHFGRTTAAKHLTQDNAWYKDYNWDNSYERRSYIYRNQLTNEQRPLTEEQFNDNNYTLNTGE